MLDRIPEMNCLAIKEMIIKARSTVVVRTLVKHTLERRTLSRGKERKNILPWKFEQLLLWRFYDFLKPIYIPIGKKSVVKKSFVTNIFYRGKFLLMKLFADEIF